MALDLSVLEPTDKSRMRIVGGQRIDYAEDGTPYNTNFTDKIHYDLDLEFKGGDPAGLYFTQIVGFAAAKQEVIISWDGALYQGTVTKNFVLQKEGGWYTFRFSMRAEQV